MDLSISSSRDGRVTTLTVAGELDLASRDDAAEQISRAVHADGVTAVILDVSGVSFLDSSGISVLVKGRRDADLAGVGYRLAGATGMVREVLRMTGVLQHLSGDAL